MGFFHQVSLISLYLNKWPIFYSNFEVITPKSLESAMLRRSPQAQKVFTLGEYFIIGRRPGRTHQTHSSETILISDNTATNHHVIGQSDP